MELFWEGLEGVVVILEEVCHQGCVFRFKKPMTGPVSLSLCHVLMDQVKALSYSYTPAPHLPACCLSPPCIGHGLTSDTVSKHPIKCPFLYVALVLMALHSNRIVTKTISQLDSVLPSPLSDNSQCWSQCCSAHAQVKPKSAQGLTPAMSHGN